MTAIRNLSVSIDRPAAEAYEFLSLPENFPDHSVTRPDGTSVDVPLRIVAKGGGCDLVLTLFRQPDMSNEKFAADAEWVMRDLLAAKRLLEAQKT